VFCPYCGKEIDEGQAFCAHCGARLAAEAAPAIAAVGRSKTPWEDRESYGLLNGFLKTVKSVLFTPADFFRNMQVQGGLTDPLLFAIIVGMIGLMFFYVWNILLPDSLRTITTEIKAAAGGGMSTNFASPVGAAMMPFMLIVWIFIASGMLHFFLLIVRGAKAGFEATFRVVSYSVSPFLFMVIPYCGMLFAMIWVLTLIGIGLREAHETSGGKATIAVLFPLLFCCGILALGAVLIMGAAAASLGAMMQMYK
jgi:hypothetical protein